MTAEYNFFQVPERFVSKKKKRKRAMNNLRHKQNNDAIKPTKNNFRQKHKLGTSKQIGNTEKMVTKIQKKKQV